MKRYKFSIAVITAFVLVLFISFAKPSFGANPLDSVRTSAAEIYFAS
jgi:hypothetical protein